ncbi:hypothetical protein BDQ17DRAFT_758390 [Cyathus striatus]|nr:hypothetical protein BDQ17DRAFT_758390 [Cyathus striatus]
MVQNSKCIIKYLELKSNSVIFMRKIIKELQHVEELKLINTKDILDLFLMELSPTGSQEAIELLPSLQNLELKCLRHGTNGLGVDSDTISGLMNVMRSRSSVDTTGIQIRKQSASSRHVKFEVPLDQNKYGSLYSQLEDLGKELKINVELFKN